MNDLPLGPNPYKTLSHELLHQRPHMTFYKDMVEINGKESDYSYAEVDSGIGMVAVNDKGEVALVGQWRYPLGHYTWEIPAGTNEAGEEPFETAQRELLEEAGATAEVWTPLGSTFMESSKTTQKSYVFLAEKLTVGANHPEVDEELVVRWVPFEEALQLIEDGFLCDALSVIGLLKAARYLRSAEPKPL